jgi:hypothetical protein
MSTFALYIHTVKQKTDKKRVPSNFVVLTPDPGGVAPEGKQNQTTFEAGFKLVLKSQLCNKQKNWSTLQEPILRLLNLQSLFFY